MISRDWKVLENVRWMSVRRWIDFTQSKPHIHQRILESKGVFADSVIIIKKVCNFRKNTHKLEHLIGGRLTLFPSDSKVDLGQFLWWSNYSKWEFSKSRKGTT
uniref:Uncharacterized protein LOC104235574 n=1 Tax=Nicotiana sylvestris TaxID=4096 RepID=A0A1U7X9Y1_NICSY|nr:PREDICTED: uncharacterized protein LOC104235574 [Nicotiana sylvestris]